MIAIELHGIPGALTGRLEIDGLAWPIAAWQRQPAGEVHARTDTGAFVLVAISGGRGGVSVGDRAWSVVGTWTGRRFAGTATRDTWVADFVARLERRVG